MSGNGHSHSAFTRDRYRIGEVSRLTETKPFVLRYWETEFPMLQPVKSPSGHRLYRREDVETVLRIKRLLYDEGFTIAGARRYLRETGAPARDGQQAGETAAAPAAIGRKTLLDLRDSLRQFLTLLENE
jgi:DNA-binding transcriptional MerR regulator